jgi:hypothetical protein
VITMIATLLAAALGVSLQAAGWTLENGWLVLVGQVISDAIALSFAALAGTLLYFDARARRGAPPPEPDLTLPERPT